MHKNIPYIFKSMRKTSTLSFTLFLDSERSDECVEFTMISVFIFIYLYFFSCVTQFLVVKGLRFFSTATFLVVK